MPFSTVRPIKHSMGLSLIYGCSPFGVYPYPLDRHGVVPSPTKRNTPKAGHLKTNMLEKWNKFMRVGTGAKKKAPMEKTKLIFQYTAAKRELSPFESQRCGEVSRYKIKEHDLEHRTNATRNYS